jgi:hypothetical protein
VKAYSRRKGSPSAIQTMAKRIKVKERPSFFTKNNKLISLIGALIVFSTFLVKDELREHARDLSSSIDAAESTFKIRSDEAKLITTVANLRPHYSISRKEPSQYPDAEDYEKIRALFDECDNEETQRSLERGLRLSELIPDAGVTQRRWEALQEDSDSVDKAADIECDFFPGMCDDKPRLSKIALEEKVETLCNKRFALAGSVGKLMSQVVKNAHDIRIRNERRDKTYDWLSIFLYTLGWGLALVGRLYGGKEMIDTD